MDQGDAHQISRAEGDLDKHTAAEKKQREAACLQVVCREKAAAPYIPLSTLPTILDLPLPPLPPLEEKKRAKVGEKS